MCRQLWIVKNGTALGSVSCKQVQHLTANSFPNRLLHKAVGGSQALGPRVCDRNWHRILQWHSYLESRMRSGKPLSQMLVHCYQCERLQAFYFSHLTWMRQATVYQSCLEEKLLLQSSLANLVLLGLPVLNDDDSTHLHMVTLFLVCMS